MAVNNSRRPNHINSDVKSRESLFMLAHDLGWSVSTQGRAGVAETRSCHGENGLKGCIWHHQGKHNAGEAKQNDPNEQHADNRLTCLSSTTSSFMRIMWIFELSDAANSRKATLRPMRIRINFRTTAGGTGAGTDDHQQQQDDACNTGPCCIVGRCMPPSTYRWKERETRYPTVHGRARYRQAPKRVMMSTAVPMYTK